MKSLSMQFWLGSDALDNDSGSRSDRDTSFDDRMNGGRSGHNNKRLPPAVLSDEHEIHHDIAMKFNHDNFISPQNQPCVEWGRQLRRPCGRGAGKFEVEGAFLFRTRRGLDLNSA
jgi:hypothetical protein